MNQQEIAQFLSKQGFTCETNKNLSAFNTLKIPATASFFITLKDRSDFNRVAVVRKTLPNNFPILFLGGGSNLVFTKDFPGLVVKIDNRGLEFKDDSQQKLVIAHAGETWSDLVDACVQKNWHGLENLSLIPGSVGASPIQNIGAYGSEMKECFQSLEALHLPSGEWKVFSAKDCQFSYRDSFFKTSAGKEYLIYSVTFQLSSEAPLNIRYPDLFREFKDHPPKNASELAEAVKKIRRKKLPDPQQIGNVGSFFKNPIISIQKFVPIQAQYPEIPYFMQGQETVKIPAAWLIDQAGWKGHRRGSVGVHTEQALVLVHFGGGSGNELWRLAQEIQASVQKKFGIQLDPEPLIL